MLGVAGSPGDLGVPGVLVLGVFGGGVVAGSVGNPVAVSVGGIGFVGLATIGVSVGDGGTDVLVGVSVGAPIEVLVGVWVAVGRPRLLTPKSRANIKIPPTGTRPRMPRSKPPKIAVSFVLAGPT
jgi:hypothetical protein